MSIYSFWLSANLLCWLQLMACFRILIIAAVAYLVTINTRCRDDVADVYVAIKLPSELLANFCTFR